MKTAKLISNINPNICFTYPIFILQDIKFYRINICELYKNIYVYIQAIFLDQIFLVSTMAVRNILACRSESFKNKAKYLRDSRLLARAETIEQFVNGAVSHSIIIFYYYLNISYYLNITDLSISSNIAE